MRNSSCNYTALFIIALPLTLSAARAQSPRNDNQTFIGTTSSSTDDTSTGGKTQSPPTVAENVSVVVGLGFAGPSDSPDYSLASNTLSSTHEGKATPQYMLGLAYPLGFNYGKNTDGKNTDGKNTDCRTNSSQYKCSPLGVFVSAKFSSESSDAVNGVTFGITHKLTPDGILSLLVAGSLSPFEQPSPGFINAAVQTVVTQKAANNPFYSQYDPVAMKGNVKDAFDGFATVLMTNTGSVTSPSYTAGGQIYSGNALITNYKPGFLIGVALTPSAISLLTKKSQ